MANGRHRQESPPAQGAADSTPGGSGCLDMPDARWYRRGYGVACRRIIAPLLVAAVCVLGLLARSLMPSDTAGGPDWAAAGILLLVLVLVIRCLLLVRSYLVYPLAQIYQWANRVRTGETSARVPMLGDGEFADLADSINTLAERIESLHDDLEAEVALKTGKLARKTLSLQLLYEVVTSVNRDESPESLMNYFMNRLGEACQASGAVARLLKDGQLERVGSYGLSEGSPHLAGCITIRQLRAGHPRNVGEISVRRAPSGEDDAGGDGFIATILLKYRESVLGSFELFVGDETVFDDETRELLFNFGQHLGVVIEQSRLDSESEKLFMVEERARLASELHDSLAQTLASLRFQVRVLDETLHQGDEQVTWEELEKLEGQVEEANHELRSLIGQFRAPFETEQVVISVRKLVERFRQDTGVSVFLQNEWSEDTLPPRMRTDVVRIVQEALANVRKHADAETVRVLIRHHDCRFMVMVEDDGIGYDDSALIRDGPAGEQLGRRILMERAADLGGELKLESEPGEGARVLLEFMFGNDGQSEGPGDGSVQRDG